MGRWAPSSRKDYAGVAVAVPVTVPYARYSTQTAHWWIGKALKALVQQAGITSKDIDGLSISSFSLAPDTAIGLTQHFGLSPRFIDYLPMGGASGILALRHAARAVQGATRISSPVLRGIRTMWIPSAACSPPFLVLRRMRSIPMGPGAPMPVSPDRVQLHAALWSNTRGFRQDRGLPAL